MQHLASPAVARPSCQTLGLILRRPVSVLVAFSMATSCLVSAFAQSDQQVCKSDGNQQDINACAEHRFRQVDGEMNRLYGTQMARLSEASKRSLRDSQRAWIAYRDNACYYESGVKGQALESHATTGPLMLYSCRESLTRQRNEVLRQYLQCTQNGCPE